MQLVAYGAQDIYLTGNPQVLYLRLSTADTPTFQWKLFGKPLTASTLTFNSSTEVEMSLFPETAI